VNATLEQLTLDDWAQILKAAVAESAQPRAERARPSDGREPVAVLADALAPRLAEELSHRLTRASTVESATTARLLTLDQLVDELPPAKAPQTWKRWLYERTRRGEIPGCVKLGGMLFFDREPALAWLRAGATTPK
jgi:hypothetical protein